MSEKSNIVWITLDSVRDDHVSGKVAPNLDEISKKSNGYRFNNCFSHSIWTLPSTTSILTGVYPSQHGAGLQRPPKSNLPDELLTIPELLSKSGYSTYAVSSNSYVSEDTGLSRGFNQFKWVGFSRSGMRNLGVKNILKYILKINTHSCGIDSNGQKHSLGYLVTEVAQDMVRGNSDPYFLYVHYNEPHRAYYPPNKSLDKFETRLKNSSPRGAAEQALDIHNNSDNLIAEGINGSESYLQNLKTMYDSEIAYTDECVADLFDRLTNGDDRDTIFIITADHGESFGEKGLLAHQFTLHDALINVPLITYNFGGDIDNSTLIQHADIFKTIFEDYGIEEEQINGVNIRKNTRDIVISERGEPNFEEIKNHCIDFKSSRFCKGLARSIRDKEYKLTKGAEDKRLYRLPNEENDIGDIEKDRAQSLHEYGERWEKSSPQYYDEESDNLEISEDKLNTLKKLGYVANS